jgi:hypothetical protein
MKDLVFSIKKIKKESLKKWTPDEDKILLASTNSICKNRWKKLSQLIPGKAAYDCYLRYRSIQPGIKKGIWLKEEDERILKGIKAFGPHWSFVARVYFRDRTPKQIRDRYVNYLDPRIKTCRFEEKEDYLVLYLYKKLGPKWSIIQRYIPFRSADAIKNRYNSSIKRNKELLMKFNFLQNNSVSFY